VLVLRSLAEAYPALADKISALEQRMVNACISVASHMHAGDGNWHVNIPVNSNDPFMLRDAETVARLVMSKAQELGGEVTGEHGVGITKIGFLTEEKLADFREFKNLVDPRNIFNPAKLTQRDLPVSPFTFSFNRLIQDIGQSGLQDKERLINLLTNIQICTRCGKCKQFCPMHQPERSLLYHPRNKNLALGALIEAIYYSQVNHGRPDPALLAQLQGIVEHCTGCGKCMAVCPVKIASAEVALDLRGYLADEGADGHPIKRRVLRHIAAKPATRIPRIARMAALGQSMQNRFVKVLPASWRNRFANPLFSGPGPRPAYRNLREVLHLDRGSFFAPQGEVKGTVLYFPGCGSSMFLRGIGMAGVYLLLRAGYAVLLPEKHLCCGYPLLAAGAHDEFAVNQDRNIEHLRDLGKKAAELGYPVSYVLTSCGSCRDGMERHFIPHIFPAQGGVPVKIHDVAQFLFERLPMDAQDGGGTHGRLLYHAPCHAETPGVNKAKAGPQYAASLADYADVAVNVSPGCCGESGMGYLTSPGIYNKIRAKKAERLEIDLAAVPEDAPVLISCPSCKLGLQRIFMNKKQDRRVLHTLEYMAERFLGPKWSRICKRALAGAPLEGGIRRAAMESFVPKDQDDEGNGNGTG
jgi:Fe-S oxidoreductase